MNEVSRMTCEEAFRRLDEYLDRELTPEEMSLVHDHLSTCEGCAAEFRFESRLLDGLKAKLRRLSVPEDLRSRVRKAIRRAEEEMK